MILPALAALLTLAIVATGSLATTAASLPGGTLSQTMLHRQAGEFAGSALIGLFAWIAFSRVDLRKLAGALVLGTIAQGVLGVVANAPMLHSLLAQVLLAGSVALVAAASKSYTDPPQMVKDYGWPSLSSLSVLLPLLIGIQVALGAAFRHRMLGLMPHVIGAMLVSIFILIVGSFVLQQCKDHKVLSGAGRLMVVTTFVQVFLGLAIFTIRSMPEQNAGAILGGAMLHVITGGVLLGVSVILGMHIRHNVLPKGES